MTATVNANVVGSNAVANTWFAAAKADLPGANKALMAAVEGTSKLADAGSLLPKTAE